MKKVIMSVLFVWIAGAAVMSLYYEGQRKANCIEREGFIKGWLWCKTDPTSRFEVADNRAAQFVKGLGWPIRLFSGSSDEQLTESPIQTEAANRVGNADINDSRRIAEVATEEQFGSAMCALNEMPGKARNFLRGSVRAYLGKRDMSELTQAFEIDEIPFYLSKCFRTHATLTMVARDSKDDFAHFYDESERAMRLILLMDAAMKSRDEHSVSKMGADARMEVQQRNEQYYR